MTQGELEKIPKGMERLLKDLEARIMRDMVRRIQQNAFSTASADWQFTRLQQLGQSERDIKEWVQDLLRASNAEIDKIYSDDTYKEYMQRGRGYQVYGRQQIPFEENAELQQLIEGVKQQTADQMREITGSMGFVKKGYSGKLNAIQLSEYYQDTLDRAAMDLHSGAFDYSTVLNRTINEMTASGLRWIDYESGWHNRVPVAARRAVMTGFRQVQGKINEQTARDLGTDSYEVTVHIGARPSHQVWEGKVYTMEQLRSVCGLGTGAGLHGWNCYHDYNAFIPGVDVRTYTDEQLEQIHEEENTPRTYQGKEYTTYEALQHQRKLETCARKYREDIYLLEEGSKGLPEADQQAVDSEIVLKQCRLRKVMSDYTSFSRKMGLPVQRDRIYQDGLKVDMRVLKSGSARNDKVKSKYTLNRARLIRTETDLKAVSSSSIINMSSEAEMAEYFASEHGVIVEGFAGKDLLGIQSPLAGYDDMLREFPELKGRIKEIHYNSRISANGNIDLDTGISMVGSKGLKDYGTGIHESAHMLDRIRSAKQNCDYAKVIVDKAKRNLKLRAGSKPYTDQVYQIVGMVKQKMAYKDPKEIFAFAMETAKGRIDNPLASEIYRLVKEG